MAKRKQPAKRRDPAAFALTDKLYRKRVKPSGKKYDRKKVKDGVDDTRATR